LHKNSNPNPELPFALCFSMVICHFPYLQSDLFEHSDWKGRRTAADSFMFSIVMIVMSTLMGSIM